MLRLAWSCDYCGKNMLTTLPNGVVYCENCRLGGYDLEKSAKDKETEK